MNKQIILDKLEKLHGWEEFEKGIPKKKDCLNWAAQVEPILKFNPRYQISFSISVRKLQCDISEHMGNQILQEMKTTLKMAIEELKHDLEFEAQPEPVKLSSPMGNYIHNDRVNDLKQISSKKFDLSKLVRFCEEKKGVKSTVDSCL